MKVAIVIIVLAAAAAVFFMNAGKTAPAPVSTAQTIVPIYEQPIPEEWQKVEGKPVNINVTPVRVNKGSQAILEFHMSEEHGYAVDAINLEFTYRYKDDDSGEWIQAGRPVGYFVKKRLEFNETLVDNTVLLSVEFEGVVPDLQATTVDNWTVRVLDYGRAMEPKQK